MVLRTIILGLALSLAFVKPAQAQDTAYCLALTAFTESRDQGEHGMALVVHTVLNRAVSRKKTACQVAYQPNQYHGVLFWPKGVDPAQRNPKAWHTAMRVVSRVMQGDWDFGDCAGAEYFYAPKVVRRVPYWSRKLPYKCTYNGHQFYGAL